MITITTQEARKNLHAVKVQKVVKDLKEIAGMTKNIIDRMEEMEREGNNCKSK